MYQSVTSDSKHHVIQLILFATLICKTTQKFAFEEHPPTSPEVKECLLECMTCKEFWGDMYDGHACANGCFLTDGDSIDINCRLGTNMPKRYAELKSTNECTKQCDTCFDRLSKTRYDVLKCKQVCEITTGRQRDENCKTYSSMFRLTNLEK